MKLIKLLFVGAGLLGTLSACYDDKGNYDYADLMKVEMEATGGTYTVAIGGTVKITPEYTLSKEDTNKDLSYRWVFEGELLSTEPVLEWTADRYNGEEDYNNLLFEITDNKNGLVYSSLYSLRVTETYSGSGLYLLSKRDGKPCVHMVREGEDEEGERIYEVLEDIYAKANGGEALPANTFKFHEHYAVEVPLGETRGDVVSQLMFVTPDQTVDVVPATFQREENTLADMFGGTVPSGLQVSDVYFMQYLDLIKDQDGRIYTRIKSTNRFFHIDEFLPEPLTFEGTELRNIEFIPSSVASQHCMLRDKDNNNRLLIIWDYYRDDFFNGDQYLVGKVEEVSSAMMRSGDKWPTDVPTIEEIFSEYELLHMASYKTDFGSYGDGLKTYYFAVLKDPESGKLYHYRFGLNLQSGKMVLVADGEKIVDIEFRELKGTAARLFNNSRNVFYTMPTYFSGWFPTLNKTLIGEGNNLYIYNHLTALNDDPTLVEQGVSLNPRLMCTFGSDVAFMSATNSTYMWGKILGVALKNGSVEVLNTEGADYSTWTYADGCIWKSQGVDLGTPMDFFYTMQGTTGVDWE